MTTSAANLYRPAQLAAELRTLRRGLGVQPGQLDARIGPILRSLCAIVDEDGSVHAVEKVAAWLQDEARRLSPIYQKCVMGAFGLDRNAKFPFYRARVQWVADQAKRSIRTTRRDIDQAIEHVAANASRMGARAIVGIRQYLSQSVKLEYLTRGMNDTNLTMLQCRITTIARDVDNSERYVAIVDEVPGETTPIAIPVGRVCKVEPVAAGTD